MEDRISELELFSRIRPRPEVGVGGVNGGGERDGRGYVRATRGARKGREKQRAEEREAKLTTEQGLRFKRGRSYDHDRDQEILGVLVVGTPPIYQRGF